MLLRLSHTHLKPFLPIGLLLFFLLACSGGDEAPSEEEVIVTTLPQSFNLGDFTLTGLSSNSRGVTVIYESGLGSDGSVWARILREVGKENKGVYYNRGGYATSELGPEPRHLVQLSDELHAVKQLVSPNEKVVLVGHSWGGAIVRTYAIRFPDHVQGIVFVDPSHENELRLTQAEEDNIVRNYAGLRGAAKESEQLIEGVEYLEDLPNLPDMPVTVLTNSPGGSSSAWSRYHRSLGNGLSAGNFRQIHTFSGHNIHVNEPELVIEAILELVNKLD